MTSLHIKFGWVWSIHIKTSNMLFSILALEYFFFLLQMSRLKSEKGIYMIGFMYTITLESYKNIPKLISFALLFKSIANMTKIINFLISHRHRYIRI